MPETSTDGFDDVLVGAPRTSRSGALFFGRVHVYYGAAAGLDLASESFLAASDSEHNEFFGNQVSGVGDVNGDGFDDVLIGTHRSTDSADQIGSVYFYAGSAEGLSRASEQRLTASDGRDHDQFGVWIAGPGDVNGDGTNDVIVGASGSTAPDQVYVFTSSTQTP